MSREFTTSMERLKRLWDDVSDPDQIARETSKKYDLFKRVTGDGEVLTGGRQVLVPLALMHVLADRGQKPAEKRFAASSGVSVPAFSKSNKELRVQLEEWEAGPSAGVRATRSTKTAAVTTPKSARSSATRKAPASGSRSRTPQSTPTRSPTKRQAVLMSQDSASTPAKRSRLELMNPHRSSQRDAEMDEMHAQQQEAQTSPSRREKLRSSGNSPFVQSPSVPLSAQKLSASHTQSAEEEGKSPSRSTRSNKGKGKANDESTPTKSKERPLEGHVVKTSAVSMAAGEIQDLYRKGAKAVELRPPDYVSDNDEAAEENEAEEEQAKKVKKQRVPWDFEYSYATWDKDREANDGWDDWAEWTFERLKTMQRECIVINENGHAMSDDEYQIQARDNV